MCLRVNSCEVALSVKWSTGPQVSDKAVNRDLRKGRPSILVSEFQIENQHIRIQFSDELHSFGHIGSLTADDYVRLTCNKRANAMTNSRVVVCDKNADSAPPQPILEEWERMSRRAAAYCGL